MSGAGDRLAATALAWEDGEALAIPGAMLKGRASWTDGAYCVTAATLAPRVLMPPHVHVRDVQVTIVVEGTVGTWLDGETSLLTAGGYGLRPAGVPHCVFNPTDEPARFMELTSPGTGFEAYMLAQGEVRARGGSLAEITRLAAEAGIAFVDDELAAVRAAYGLTRA
jgi:mannose-6-phosphate isomerase-like protein (cupin superfamily)